MKKSVRMLISAILAGALVLNFSCSNAAGSSDSKKTTAEEENGSGNGNSGGSSSDVIGEENEDGTYTVLSWKAADYALTTSTTSTSVSGTYGDVAITGGAKSKCDSDGVCSYVQLSKSGSASKGLKFIVPVNASKIIINAKCGSSSASGEAAKSASLTAASITSDDWSTSASVDNTAYTDVTLVPSFAVTSSKDEDGNETSITQKTIVVYNSDSSNSVNITSVKVIAPTEWVKTSDTVVSNKDTDTGDKYGEEDNSDSVINTLPSLSGTVVSGSVSITKSEGWLNSAYIQFTPYTDASGYLVKVDDVQIDDALIRTYADYVRADALGLASGSHTMSVQAVLANGDTTEASTATMTVIDHDRSGYAFADGNTPGAYKADGTLKDNAAVIYVTDSNVLTVTYNGKTGLQEILSESSLKSVSNPLDIRVIGTITSSTFTKSYWGSSAEGLQIKNNKYPVTLEGVGSDAGFHGFGLLVRNSDHIEIANLGFMCAADDNISLDTDNQYTWVHNTDHFYGSTGGDSDQAKGDGTIDVKGKSSYQTYSYNHFWDSGKSSLCGMKSETTTSRLTYHHNWFDHSDSRHPRIRTQTVHIYNNYFDGNSKYGVGVTMGASAFVEQNFFRNAHDPMMSSMQGTDATGDGTFSGETGGWIKAYNNKFTECNTNGVKFQYVTNKDSSDGDCDIDAYVVDNREDTVPSTYTTVSGSTTYNNFDTSEELYTTVAPTDPDTAKAMVVTYAGRHNADFTWTFDNASDDASYAVNTDLKSAIVNYTSSLVSVQGFSSSSSGSNSDSEDNGDSGSSDDDNGGSSSEDVSGDTGSATISWTKSEVSDSRVSGWSSKQYKTAQTYNGASYSYGAKLNSSGSITLTLESEYSVTFVLGTDKTGYTEGLTIDGEVVAPSDNVVTVTLASGAHTITKGSSETSVFLIILE